MLAPHEATDDDAPAPLELEGEPADELPVEERCLDAHRAVASEVAPPRLEPGGEHERARARHRRDEGVPGRGVRLELVERLDRAKLDGAGRGHAGTARGGRPASSRSYSFTCSSWKRRSANVSSTRARDAAPKARRRATSRASPSIASASAIRVARRDESTVLALAHELRHPADAREDERQPRGHRLEDGHRQPLGEAREHEHVRGCEVVGDVVALTQHAHPFEPGLGDGALDCPAVAAVADDREAGEPGLEPGAGADERDEVLRVGEPPDADHLDGALVAVRADRHRVGVHRVVDDHGLGIRAGLRRQAGRSLGLGHADDRRRQAAHRPVAPEVDAGPHPRRRLERPTVHGEHPDRHPRQRGREPPEDAGLRAVGMDDVGPEPAAEPVELPEAERIARGDRATDMAERDVVGAGGAHRVAQRAGPVRRHRDVEARDEGGHERTEVGLRPATLGQRHENEDPRPVVHSLDWPPGSLPTMLRAGARVRYAIVMTGPSAARGRGARVTSPETSPRR